MTIDDSGKQLGKNLGSDQDALSSARTVLLQIAVIAVVGLYLFAMVLLYVMVPLAAAGVVTVAATILVASFFRRDAPPPD